MNEENTRPEEEESEPEHEMDPALLEMAMERLRSEQNFGAAVLAGLAAAVVGAVAWAAITAVTGYQIGYMAVGVGFIVGSAVRVVGKGVDRVFGIAGALLALLGCLLGNLFTVCYFVSVAVEMGILEVLTMLDPAIVIDMLVTTFSPMDLLFYGIAVYEGYRLPFRQLTEEELSGILRGSGANPQSP